MKMLSIEVAEYEVIHEGSVINGKNILEFSSTKDVKSLSRSSGR